MNDEQDAKMKWRTKNNAINEMKPLLFQFEAVNYYQIDEVN